MVAPYDAEHRLATVGNLEEGHIRGIGLLLSPEEIRGPRCFLGRSREQGDDDEPIEGGDDKVREVVLLAEPVDTRLDIGALLEDVQLRGYDSCDRYGLLCNDRLRGFNDIRY